jgi:hypothetical protein
MGIMDTRHIIILTLSVFAKYILWKTQCLVSFWLLFYHLFRIRRNKMSLILLVVSFFQHLLLPRMRCLNHPKRLRFYRISRFFLWCESTYLHILILSLFENSFLSPVINCSILLVRLKNIVLIRHDLIIMNWVYSFFSFLFHFFSWFSRRNGVSYE